MNIQNKNIIFIGIGFYEYETFIKNKLQEYGGNVIYYNSLNRTYLIRILLRLHLSKIVSRVRERKMNRFTKSIHSKIDCLFVIKGECLTESNILMLKSKCIAASIFLYLWDSVNRHDNFTLLQKHFENIYTFDRLDSIKYGLKFRPLFFLNNNENSNFPIIYDVSFVGWMHSDRYNILKQLKDLFEHLGIKYKFVLMLGITSYLTKRYLTHEIRKKDEEMFIFTSLNYSEYSKISMNSNVILDISHSLQDGLSMRIIESIGFGKKILTTNKDIQNYKIIDQNSFKILDRNFPNKISLEFIWDVSKSSTDTNYFELDSFVNEIFGTIN